MNIISFIITAYNVSEYISETLYSLYNQDCDNRYCYNIIIVEDCSTDNTLNIIKDFITNNKKGNINYYLVENKENVGAGLSRRFGVYKAKELNDSKYTMFIDGDDTVSSNLISELSSYINSDLYDMISFGIRRNGIVYVEEEGEYETEGEKYNYMYSASNPFLNNKLIRLSIWDKTEYSALRFIEDIPTEFRCIYYANKIKVLPIHLYEYRVRPNSLCTQSTSAKRTIYRCLSAIETVEFFKTTDSQMMKFFYTPKDVAFIFKELELNNIKEEDIEPYRKEYDIVVNYMNNNK